MTADADSVEQQVSKEKEKADALEKIYFTVDDTNIVRNLKEKQINVDFYTIVDKTEYVKNRPHYTTVKDSSDQYIYLKKIEGINIYRKDKEGKYNPKITYLSSGITYRADIPLSLLTPDKNYIEIYVVAKTTIFKYNNDGTESEIDNDSLKAYSSFRIQKVGLTDLD